MFRRVIAALLLAALLFTLAACSGNRSSNRGAAANVGKAADYVSENQDDAEKGDSNLKNAFSAKPQDDRTKNGFSQRPEDYKELSWEDYGATFSNEGENDYGRFFTPGKVLLIWEPYDGVEHMLLDSGFGFMLMRKGTAQEGWHDIEVGDAINVYFQLIGMIYLFEFNKTLQDGRKIPEHLLMDETVHGVYHYFTYYEWD